MKNTQDSKLNQNSERLEISLIVKAKKPSAPTGGRSTGSTAAANRCTTSPAPSSATTQAMRTYLKIWNKNSTSPMRDNAG